MVAIQLLDKFAETLMAVVLLIPHVFVISDLAFLIQAKTHQAVHCLTRMCNPRRILLSQLEHNLLGSILDHFGLYGAQTRKDLGQPVPLAGNLVARVAVRKGVVVDGFCRVNLHVILTGAATVQPRYGVNDLLVLGRDGHGAFWVRFVVDILGDVAWIGVVASEFVRVWVRLVVFVEVLRGLIHS